MGDHGSVYAHFRRAVERGNLPAAEAAARELPRLSPLTRWTTATCWRRGSPAKYQRAALRWHSRLEREREGLTFNQSLLALAALQALTDGDRGTPLAFLRWLVKRPEG